MCPDVGVTECRKPPAQRGFLPTKSLGQFDHQLDGTITSCGLQQVFECHLRGTIDLVPVGRSHVQPFDVIGLSPTELVEQKLPEQGMVAVPVAVAIEWYHKRAGRL
jgi:hypothetical protein